MAQQRCDFIKIYYQIHYHERKKLNLTSNLIINIKNNIFKAFKQIWNGMINEQAILYFNLYCYYLFHYFNLTSSVFN